VSTRQDGLELLCRAAELALDSKLTDDVRVQLYELALSIATTELYNIEDAVAGLVSPAAFMLIQQIGVLCDPTTTPEKLLDRMEAFADAAKEKDGWSGEPALS
jgi:hypothetical protein